MSEEKKSVNLRLKEDWIETLKEKAAEKSKNDGIDITIQDMIYAAIYEKYIT